MDSGPDVVRLRAGVRGGCSTPLGRRRIGVPVGWPWCRSPSSGPDDPRSHRSQSAAGAAASRRPEAIHRTIRGPFPGRLEEVGKAPPHRIRQPAPHEVPRLAASDGPPTGSDPVPKGATHQAAWSASAVPGSTRRHSRPPDAHLTDAPLRSPPSRPRRWRRPRAHYRAAASAVRDEVVAGAHAVPSHPPRDPSRTQTASAPDVTPPTDPKNIDHMRAADLTPTFASAGLAPPITAICRMPVSGVV